MHAASSIFLHAEEQLEAVVRVSHTDGYWSLILGAPHAPGSFILHGTREQIRQVVFEMVNGVAALTERPPQEVPQ